LLNTPDQSIQYQEQPSTRNLRPLEGQTKEYLENPFQIKKFKDLLKNDMIPKSKYKCIDHDRLNEDKEDFLKLDKRK